MDSDEIQKIINERRDALLKALDEDKQPKAEPSFLCDYCPFVDICKI